MMTEISDKVWSDVLAKNSLAKLEKISCQKCTKVPSTLKIYENSAKTAEKKCCLRVKVHLKNQTFDLRKIGKK